MQSLGRNDKFIKLSKKTFKAITIFKTIKDFKGRKGVTYEGDTIHGIVRIPFGGGGGRGKISAG